MIFKIDSTLKVERVGDEYWLYWTDDYMDDWWEMPELPEGEYWDEEDYELLRPSKRPDELLGIFESVEEAKEWAEAHIE